MNLATKIHSYDDKVDVKIVLESLLTVNKAKSISMDNVKNVYAKIKQNNELRSDIRNAKNIEGMCEVFTHAIFDRWAYAPKSLKSRVQEAVTKDLEGRIVTVECHELVVNARLTPNEFSSGKGIANIHKEHGFKKQRESCT